MDKWKHTWRRGIALPYNQKLNATCRINEGVAISPHDTNTVTEISSKNCLWVQKLVGEKKDKKNRTSHGLKIPLIDYESKNTTFPAEEPTASTPTTGPRLTIQWEDRSVPCASWEAALRGTQNGACGSLRRHHLTGIMRECQTQKGRHSTKKQAVFFTGEGSWR